MRCRCCGQPIPEESISALGMWTNTESRILRTLEDGKQQTSDELASKVWEGDLSNRRDIHNRLTVNIYRIRAKLCENDLPWQVNNLPNQGYWLKGQGAN